VKYVLGGVTYTSKSAVEARCRAILGPMPRREYTLSGADLEFVRALFDQHPDALEKSDVTGPKSFRVVDSSMGTHCLAVARADGTWERWSYASAIKPPTPWTPTTSSESS
jgi:hypothetical protein